MAPRTRTAWCATAAASEFWAQTQDRRQPLHADLGQEGGLPRARRASARPRVAASSRWLAGGQPGECVPQFSQARVTRTAPMTADHQFHQSNPDRRTAPRRSSARSARVDQHETVEEAGPGRPRPGSRSPEPDITDTAAGWPASILGRSMNRPRRQQPPRFGTTGPDRPRGSRERGSATRRADQGQQDRPAMIHRAAG